MNSDIGQTPPLASPPYTGLGYCNKALNAAQARGFDIFVTADKNLSYQQNLQRRTLALVVLDTNSWKKIRRDLLTVMEAADAATPGSFQAVSLKPTPKR